MSCYVYGLTFALQLICGSLVKQPMTYWQAVKRIFCYICGASYLVLCYQNGNLSLRCYSNTDWSGDLKEFRSISGYIFPLSGGAISWSGYKKESCIVISTMEAKCIACCPATQEVIWLSSFVQYLSLTLKVDGRQHYCD